MKKYYAALSTLVVASGLMMTASPSFAQNEIEQRDQRQENRIQRGEADGRLSPRQAERDQSRLNREERVQSRQEERHGGHLTRAEERHDNRHLNRGSHRINHAAHNEVHR